MTSSTTYRISNHYLNKTFETEFHLSSTDDDGDDDDDDDATDDDPRRLSFISGGFGMSGNPVFALFFVSNFQAVSSMYFASDCFVFAMNGEIFIVSLGFNASQQFFSFKFYFFFFFKLFLKNKDIFLKSYFSLIQNLSYFSFLRALKE